MKSCQWCDNTFTPNVKYQIYCSSECREQATKEKIAERYNKKKVESRLNKIRKCKSCGNSLSIYNDDVLCVACEINGSEVSKALKELKGMADGKSQSD
jgi:ribosomal protein S27E